MIIIDKAGPATAVSSSPASVLLNSTARQTPGPGAGKAAGTLMTKALAGFGAGAAGAGGASKKPAPPQQQPPAESGTENPSQPPGQSYNKNMDKGSCGFQ